MTDDFEENNREWMWVILFKKKRRKFSVMGWKSGGEEEKLGWERDWAKAGHRTGLYRYHSGSFGSGSLRDGTGHREPGKLFSKGGKACCLLPACPCRPVPSPVPTSQWQGLKADCPSPPMNIDEFTNVNETSFSRSGPIEINSNTPIIHEEVYERHYGNYQENEEVEIDEEDLDDTPTSPDLNSIEVPLQEDNPPVGTSHPPIVPTRGKTKGSYNITNDEGSSVASEAAFSVARFQIGNHRYLLAEDSLEISVLFRDWINYERRNQGLPKLDNSAIGIGSDDDMKLQVCQQALPRPIVDYSQSIADVYPDNSGPIHPGTGQPISFRSGTHSFWFDAQS
ncbi:hypothetical protein H5410_004662 [Solanum commersonii]|uniref:Uncharacterized protein n=1 Tax=Solanum commersonii TaxID=4109 RepID=A0A9J6B8G4_SOLCO|nr:hypothetical protein H5410_004662 [Solanum commersonii]